MEDRLLEEESAFGCAVPAWGGGLARRLALQLGPAGAMADSIAVIARCRRRRPEVERCE